LDLKVVACPGASQFSQKVFKYLQKRNPRTALVKTDFFTFNNKEVKCVLNESIRGSDVFIIQDVANTKTGSVNDNLMTLFSTIDTCNHASCEEINVILPTFPYARQHKKTQREGLTASLICNFLEKLGVKRIITLDIHSREIQNAFQKTIMENLHASYQIAKKLKDSDVPLQEITIVAPDSGSVSRNTFFANTLKRPLAIMYKERDFSKENKGYYDSNIISQKLIGEIKSSSVLLFDDMIDTGGTILKAAKFLKESGADKIFIACSLPFFNDPALKDFDEAHEKGYIHTIFGTNAVFNPNLWKKKWFEMADVSELFADVIFRINEKISLADLLNGSEEIYELFYGESE